jgi:molybdenum cofactor synthesis domain-containing protein
LQHKKSNQTTAEIISIGNELLIGHTLDTNSHWIANQLNSIGWVLQRVAQIPDSSDSIVSAIRESLRRKPFALITLGGLGPTHDDMTLANVARALRRPMELNRDALDLVEEHYHRLEAPPKLTKYRTKMATLPRGATPLTNPIGTAPGVLIRQSGTTIFCLPGVPSEMKAIFRTSVASFLRSFGASRPSELQFRIAGIIESALAPILDNARRSYPGLYFKSHPRGRETGVRPLILLHIYSTEPESAHEIMQAAEYILQRVSRLSK